MFSTTLVGGRPPGFTNNKHKGIMGLDFNGSECHWSYSGFNSFRAKLAKSIAVNLEMMNGFGGPVNWEGVDDGIKHLLNHSDCDGHLTPSQMKKVYPRILEIVKDWPDDDYDKEQAIQFANDMKKLVAKGQQLIFC